MKKAMLTIVLLAAALLLTACGKAPQAVDARPSPALASDGSVQLAEQPAVDLTMLSGTMAYAELYNMSSNTAQYEGKTVRMQGQYYAAYIESVGKTVHWLMVTDQQACCSIGVEFRAAGSLRYPDDFPPLHSTIELTGLFGTTEVSGNTYPLLTVNEIKLLEPPPQAAEQGG